MKHVFVTIRDKLQIVSKLWKANVGTRLPRDFERQRGAIVRCGALLAVRISCTLCFCPVLHQVLVCRLQLWQSSENVAVICEDTVISLLLSIFCSLSSRGLIMKRYMSLTKQPSELPSCPSRFISPLLCPSKTTRNDWHNLFKFTLSTYVEGRPVPD